MAGTLCWVWTESHSKHVSMRSMDTPASWVSKDEAAW